MADAEAQLYRRIKDLRARARAGDEASPPPPLQPDAPQQVPDLRTLLARAENHVDELRATAATLEQSLPTRVGREVERVLDAHESSRRSAELRDLMVDMAARIDQVNRDLLAERLGRVEDLELVVELLSAGVAAMRQDVADLAAHVEAVTTGMESVVKKLDQPIQVTLERTRQSGVRDLFRPTGESGDDEPVPEPAGSPAQSS